MAWSWFAEDDFGPLAKSGAGVAYLALTVSLKGQSEVVADPRGIAVRIPPEMYRMAVIRFETERPAYSARQRELAVRMVAEMAGIAGAPAVQIDFDAPRSAWPFYRQLLTEVRARLGPKVFLSMTALVSWCDSGQSWMACLPVDEIVPMAFSMGAATPAIMTMLRQGGQFAYTGCRGSIGVEVGNPYGGPPATPRKGQRAYFFPNSQNWTRALLEAARKEIRP